MCFHKQADMSPDCWCVYYLRNLAIMQRMRTRIFKVSLLSFTELLWSAIFMIANSDRGCSIEWPRARVASYVCARTVEGKVSSGSRGQLSPYRLNYYNITTLSYCSLCVCKYIDISTRQARRRESVNKMNALSSQNILIWNRKKTILL